MAVTGWLVCSPTLEVTKPILAPIPNRFPPAYSITNRSNSSWDDVVITVNGQFRTVFARIGVNEAIILTPAQLLDTNGKPAPEHLVVEVVHIQTRHHDFSVRPISEK